MYTISGALEVYHMNEQAMEYIWEADPDTNDTWFDCPAERARQILQAKVQLHNSRNQQMPPLYWPTTCLPHSMQWFMEPKSGQEKPHIGWLGGFLTALSVHWACRLLQSEFYLRYTVIAPYKSPVVCETLL